MVKVSKMSQEQILRLHFEGKSIRVIAKLLKVGRNTVRSVIARGAVITPGPSEPEWGKDLQWERIHLEVSRGIQINILYQEHASHRISYSQFWREYHRRYPATKKVTLRLSHKPGERCFFDFCEGIDIIDPSTGGVTKTSLLCGVMAMSSMTFGEFTLSQRRDDLIRAMENIFHQFGGVTPYVTVDNQRAAINRAHWYDPEVNPEFVDFANHWGFAVLPARPKRPQDKGAKESGIGVIQRQFYQEMRGRKFYSLPELNIEFGKYIDGVCGKNGNDF